MTPESSAGPTIDATAAQPPQAAPHGRRRRRGVGQLEVAERSGRYTLIAALCAALVSSFVSAGAAVYVSINEANRDQGLTFSQALRTDRHKVYTEFLTALTNYEMSLSILSAAMSGNAPRDLVGAKMADIATPGKEFLNALNAVWLAGSGEVYSVASRFLDLANAYFRDTWEPFNARYANFENLPTIDAEQWRQDSHKLSDGLVQFINRAEELKGEFLEKARGDLG
ncbi:hypothetical protein [Nocardia sp. bgisy134]|uniref:hypothetical protein n=1 Tax=unclassified Nocardia TaxID=2637762 RepID=UPI003D736C68